MRLASAQRPSEARLPSDFPQICPHHLRNSSACATCGGGPTAAELSQLAGRLQLTARGALAALHFLRRPRPPLPRAQPPAPRQAPSMNGPLPPLPPRPDLVAHTACHVTAAPGASTQRARQLGAADGSHRPGAAAAAAWLLRRRQAAPRPPVGTHRKRAGQEWSAWHSLQPRPASPAAPWGRAHGSQRRRVAAHQRRGRLP